ncbi:MAG: TonB-dependent receptor domain-containing protein [Candidatus Sulfotelmatobacter sp.]
MKRGVHSFGLVASLLALFLFLFGSCLAFGQSEAGSIVGSVHDATGAVITGAAVKALSVETRAERLTVTGASGQYSIPGLTPEKYEVTISNKGFQTFKSVVEVTVGGTVTVDAQLAVGQSSTVVEVSATSAGTEVNTQTQELSQLINTQQLAQLPSLTRNPYDFVAMSGNVSNGDTTSNGATMSSGGGGQELSSRGVGFSINGQRESGTEILLDGVENIAIFSVGIGENVPIDGVQEYSIVTNNFAAEYGRASGGVVNVTTKSGTNAFHGSVWEFNRLSAYTANTYNNDANDLPKGGYTRNQFGFQAGGPIIKNKLFVSESTEFTRVRSNSVQHAEVFDPTFIGMLPANAQAYFSAFGGTTGLTPNGSPITAGALAANTANPLIVNPINGITPVAATQPIFDPVSFIVPYNDGGGPPQNSWSLVGRLDYNLSDKTQMFFRIGREREDLFNGTNDYSAYSQYNSGTLNQNMIYLFSVNHAFNNNLLNNTKLSFARYNDATSYNAAYQSIPNLMFYPGSDPLTGASISTPGLENNNAPGTGGLPAGGPQNTIQFEHDLSWTKGKHNVRFGGQYTYIQLNYGYGAYAQAVEQLGGSQQDSMDDLVNFAGNPGGSQLGGSSGFSARVNPEGALPCPVDVNGNPVSPCPANSVVTPPLPSAAYGRSYRYNDWALYGQDSFRLTPRLTLNYGMRYEHYGVQHNNISSLDSNFYPGAGSDFYEQIRAGQVFIANQSPVGQFWAPSWGTAAPRVGFAYDLFGDGKSSIRGGFGISYERNFGNVTYNASFNPPASAVLSSSCPADSATCTTLVTNNDLGPLGLPGPSTNLGPTELRYNSAHIHVAQTQFWSLAVQREVARNTVVEVGYSGANGVHLYDLNNANLQGIGQVYLGDPAVDSTDVNAGSTTCNPGNVSPTGVCLTRPNFQYSAINQRGSGGTSAYDALNFKFQTQNLRNTGLSMVANYTWAHSLDDTSSTFSDSLQGGSGNGYGSLGYTLLSDPKLDWGSSDYDVRSRFVVSPIWQTPWYKSEKGLGEALGGWTATGIFTARSGIPFTGYDLDNDFNFYTFPRLTPATAPTYKVSSNPGAPVAPNTYNLLTLPAPLSVAPLNPVLGISDFGPFPAGMIGRNRFRGAGAWNFDSAVSKDFKLTERFGLTFRAEGFNIFNHHNMYVNTFLIGYTPPVPPATTQSPLIVQGLKGGLNTLAEGGNNDERRFGQFSLRLTF